MEIAANLKERSKKAGLNFFEKIKLLPDYNLFDYSKSIYQGSEYLMEIFCKICNEYFHQWPSVHIKGHGCPKCGKQKAIINKTENFENFKLKASKIHNNFYQYPINDYINTRNKVTILCPEHGFFEQFAYAHLSGKGCKFCGSNNNTSKPEFELIQFFKDNNIFDIETSNRTLLSNEIDIYLYGFKIGIEYNGLYWHSELKKENNYHLLKTEEAESKNIRLIHIFEDEWIYKKSIVLSRLRYLTNNINNKISARNCYIKEITEKESKLFIEKYSLDFYQKTDIKIGLFLDDILISVFNCNKYDNNIYEIINYCTIINHIIRGGFTKLLNYFEKTYKPKILNVSIDRRWFNNENIFTKNNFQFINKIEPQITYIKGQKRFKNNNDENLLKIYDSGKFLFSKQY